MELISEKYFSPETRETLKTEFKEAQPYPHIVMPDFLASDFADSLFENFPTVDKLKRHYKGLNENKSEGANFETFHPDFLKLKNALMSNEFYEMLSEVTGIKDIFITDDALGAGLHQGSNGSFLDIHIDFNIHNRLNVHRRLNMLIYLNKGWKEEWGGHLEMWNADMSQCMKKVLPTFNTAVVFETSEISYHGYSKINVPEGVTRKSFYSYFYTKEREGAVKYHDTVFRSRPDESGSKRVKTAVKEKLKNSVKSSLKKVGINI